MSTLKLNYQNKGFILVEPANKKSNLHHVKISTSMMPYELTKTEAIILINHLKKELNID